MGRDSPRSFPLLATPTPQVRVVLYPEQSFPTSKHCVQYGLLLSHFVWRSWQAKQSSAAPVVGALLRRFRGEVGGLVAAGGGASIGVMFVAMLVFEMVYKRVEGLSKCGNPQGYNRRIVNG